MKRTTSRLLRRLVTGTALVMALLAAAGAAWVLVLMHALDDTREPDEPVTLLDLSERDGYQVEQLSVRSVDDIEDAFDLSLTEAHVLGRHVVEFYCEHDLDRQIARGTFTATSTLTRDTDAETTDVVLRVIENPGC